MQAHVSRWIPIALFLLLAMFSYAVRAKNAWQTQTPCRPKSRNLSTPTRTPAVSIIMLCPDADRR